MTTCCKTSFCPCSCDPTLPTCVTLSAPLPRGSDGLRSCCHNPDDVFGWLSLDGTALTCLRAVAALKVPLLLKLAFPLHLSPVDLHRWLFESNVLRGAHSRLHSLVQELKWPPDQARPQAEVDAGQDAQDGTTRAADDQEQFQFHVLQEPVISTARVTVHAVLLSPEPPSPQPAASAQGVEKQRRGSDEATGVHLPLLMTGESSVCLTVPAASCSVCRWDLQCCACIPLWHACPPSWHEALSTGQEQAVHTIRGVNPLRLACRGHGKEAGAPSCRHGHACICAGGRHRRGPPAAFPASSCSCLPFRERGSCASAPRALRHSRGTHGV